MTIFSRIIAGEIPCYKIAETENCFAFLDINPLVKGHVLCNYSGKYRHNDISSISKPILPLGI